MVEQTPEQIRTLNFSELLDAWHKQPKNQDRLYVVADAKGEPISRTNEKGTDRYVLLQTKVEDNHELDEENNPVVVGTKYAAYELTTSFSDDTTEDTIEAYWDDEYFEKELNGAQTYIPLRDFVKSRGARLPKRKKKPSAPPVPNFDQTPKQPELSRAQRIAKEIHDSWREFHNVVTQLLSADDPFSRIWHARFLRMQVLERLSGLESGVSEVKFFDGMRLIQGKQSLRGTRIAGAAENPDHTVSTLVIQLVQKTQPLTQDQTVTRLPRPLAEDLGAIVAEVQNLTEAGPQEFRNALQVAGIEQVRVEIISWRERAEAKYDITIPIAGNIVPEK